MDSDRFDDVARALSPLLSRRGLAGLLGLAVLGTAEVAEAKRKKRKKRRKKKNKNGKDDKPQVEFNQFGCVNVGDFCENAGQCCSGICQNDACQAHDVATCQSGQTDLTCSGVNSNVDCITPGGGDGLCLTTTGNAGFCAGDREVAPCVTCSKDADCVSTCGLDAACVICANCPDGRTCAGSTPESC
ncbi:MAG: conotoxin [Thermomicrobiales bacterium]